MDRHWRSLLAAGLVIGVLGLVGCTPTPAPAPAVVRFTAARDVARPVVIAAPTAAGRAVEASRALFRSSPGVVVAADGDPAAQQRAAKAAQRLRVPLLLVPGGTGSTVAASPTSAATEGDAVVKEVRRLGAEWVASDGGALRIPGLRRRPLDDARVPKAARTTPTVALATTADEDTAATASARAAGAEVLPVTADLNADHDAVVALAGAKRARAVLIGAVFADRQDLAWSVAAARTGWEYPGGGQRPFDGRLFVALYGTPGAGSLGVLGRQGTAATIDRVKQLSSDYEDLVDRPVVPALEMIATVAAGSPLQDGDYSNELAVEDLEPYVDAALRADVAVVLDLQPGRSDFLTQAKRYESLLRRPGVGLALDPEWRLGPKEKPLVQIGAVSAAEVNRTTEWLAGLVRDHGLPPKMLVLHQFRLDMLPDRQTIVVDRPELDVLIHVDGQGRQGDKQATWRAIRQDAPKVAWGWKNFLEKDPQVLTPCETIDQVDPTPDLITYQ